MKNTQRECLLIRYQTRQDNKTDYNHTRGKPVVGSLSPPFCFRTRASSQLKAFINTGMRLVRQENIAFNPIS